MCRVGMLLHGYCNGYFNYDFYGRRRIEAVGVDWIVARHEDGKPDFAQFDSAGELEEKVGEWSIKPDDDEDFPF